MKLPHKLTKTLNPDELYKVLGYMYLDIKEMHETIENLQKEIATLKEKNKNLNSSSQQLDWINKYEEFFNK